LPQGKVLTPPNVKHTITSNQTVWYQTPRNSLV